VARAQDFNARQDTYAVRHANGTGPMRLEHHEPDLRTRLVRHASWWGWTDPRSGNLAQAHFVVIKSDAARLAALAAGEVDLLLDPPHAAVARLKADPRVALAQMPGLGQQYLAFDHSRNELHDADVKGRNPFKDARVRRAVYLAINVPLIIDKVLHGQAVPTGAFISPLIDGAPAELERRLPYDPARARLLLGEAGYPNGFAVTLDCLNVPWREAACQAVATMLTQVGIRTTLRTGGGSAFFPRLSLGAVSFAEFGWTPTADAWNTLNSLVRSPEGNGLGSFNVGRYRNPKIDALIDSIRTEPILRRRRALVSTVLRLLADELPLVPLYRPTVTWAMARRVSALQWPDDTLELRWVSKL
jgi:peptide/nickel transport system substrate-binding protein